MKKVPYGIFNYKVLKEEDYLYVDKTMYLSKLERAAKTLIYLKPGRFGKSLFTSMMYYYYDVNSRDLFSSLFKDTYVYEFPTVNKNNYYVLKFDFSGISSNLKSLSELENCFKDCVVTGINNFIENYRMDYVIDSSKTSEAILKYFLSYLYGQGLEYKLYVMIDEYDNFTNGILEGDTTLFKSVIGENGFVKSFYAVIKEYIGLGIVDRFYATGICPITLNSMTTGFNIATDISTDIEFNSMVGLTHEEVKGLIKELDVLQDVQDEIYNMMLEYYDGYLFSYDLGEESRVFNATLVMYLLSNYQRLGYLPDKLYDNNIVVNYGKIDNLLKLQNNNYYKEIIEDILEKEEITGLLKTQFNLVEDFTRDDIISLLYYFGYLTIKEKDIVGSIVFRVPNLVMKETYGNYFLKMLREREISVDSNKINIALREIVLEGKIDTITSYISDILRLVDNRLFKDLKEADIELLYFALLKSDNINVYTEYSCNGGYADVYICGRKKPIKNNVLIELKYIKKSEYSEVLIDKKKIEAEKQLISYSSDQRISNVRKYIVIFVGNEVKLLEEVL